MSIRLVLASDVGVEPAYIRGFEADGMVFFSWEDTAVVGAQCHACHVIVWTDARDNAILSGPVPQGIPESGEGYRRYYFGKLDTFLKSIPSCPKCGGGHFDRYINNVEFPRFVSGRELPETVTNADVINVPPQTVAIYVLQASKDGDL